MEFVKTFAKTVSKPTGGNDDSIDRLSWKATGMMMVTFCLIITATQYVGEPIECWCPAEFTSNYVDWTRKLCWIKNTYYVNIDDPVPKLEKDQQRLVYYQWTPFILLFQALCFFLPQLVWKAIVNQAGFSLKNMTLFGEVFALATKVNERDQTVKCIAQQLSYYLSMRRRRHQTVFAQKMKIFCNKRKGNFLVFFYMIIKSLYFTNCILQFYLLSVLLGTDFLSFGSNIIKNFTEGLELPDSPYFPRVTLCDFKVRGYPEIIRPYTVECVLSINLFNEKIFIFIWFWLCIVAALTGLSFISWVLRMSIPGFRFNYIKQYITTFRPKSRLSSDKNKFSSFVHKYLRDDGVFMIRMLATNASDLVAGEVVCALWEDYSLKPMFSDDDEEEVEM